MLKKVFNYIKNNEMCTVNQIAEVLDLSGVEILASVNELHKRKFVKITPVPLDNNNESVFYSAVKNGFVDASEFCICKTLFSVRSDTESTEFGYWDTCCICGKHLEDGFHYYDHYDGEDHEDVDSQVKNYKNQIERIFINGEKELLN